LAIRLVCALITLCAFAAGQFSAVTTSEDCLKLEPAELKVVSEGYQWIVADKRSTLMTFNLERDARLALQVAQHFRQMCFVGRSNSRPNRQDFITVSWKEPFGKLPTISPEDCKTYDSGRVSVVRSGDGWAASAPELQIMTDKDVDAARIALVMKHSSATCFIGRNAAEEHKNRKYIRYWR
jgi:hypothetical protein